MKPLRDMSFSNSAVTTLSKAALVTEVAQALSAWAKSMAPGCQCVLIGGLALSFYTRPRTTMDIDVLFLKEADIPDDVPGFRRARPHAFRNIRTHVEVEVVTPGLVNLPVSVVKKVFDTAIKHGTMLVASPAAMIVLKLWGADTPKRRHKDLADVQAILEGYTDVDQDFWELSPKHRQTLSECREIAES